jgi:hypothetical protein
MAAAQCNMERLLRESMRAEYASAPPLETHQSELEEGVVIVGKQGAEWARNRTDQAVAAVCERQSVFMRAAHVDMVVSNKVVGLESYRAEYDPDDPEMRQDETDETENAVPRGEEQDGDEDGPHLSALPNFMHNVAPVVTAVTPVHDGMAPLEVPHQYQDSHLHHEGMTFSERMATSKLYKVYPNDTRVSVPDYVIRHAMRWTMLFQAAGQNPSAVDYDKHDPGTALSAGRGVSNGRSVRRIVFDPIKTIRTWRQIRVPNQGKWRMPCSQVPGAIARTYCRMFGVYNPLVPFTIVHGMAIFEGLTAYTIFPYAVVQLGTSDDSLVDVTPDANRLKAAPYTTFFRLPEGVFPPTMHVLKDTSKCTRCEAKAVMDCPTGCACARYCSPGCVRLHAPRHVKWCKVGRVNTKQVAMGFVVPLSEKDYN